MIYWEILRGLFWRAVTVTPTAFFMLKKFLNKPPFCISFLYFVTCNTFHLKIKVVYSWCSKNNGFQNNCENTKNQDICRQIKRFLLNIVSSYWSQKCTRVKKFVQYLHFLHWEHTAFMCIAYQILTKSRNLSAKIFKAEVTFLNSKNMLFFEIDNLLKF